MLFSLISSIRGLFKFIIFILVVATLLGVVLAFFYPIGYKDYIVKYSRDQGIDPLLVSAMINVESNYNKDAISSKNAKGLMQISPQTGLWGAEELGIQDYREELLFDPKSNIQIGTWYIKNLMIEFNGDINLVLASYNAGSGNVRKWLNDTSYSMDGKSLNKIPFKETEDYLVKVALNHKIYKALYKKYMEKPDSINTVYIDAIINIRTLLIKFIKSFR